MSFPDRFKIAMGRSFKGLVVYTRMGASLNLSRGLCGSGAGNEVLSGQSLFVYAQMSADARRSELKAAHYIRQAAGMHARIAQIVGNTYNLAAIGELLSILIRTLQLRGGSGVDAPRPLYLKRRCGGIKEM